MMVCPVCQRVRDFVFDGEREFALRFGLLPMCGTCRVRMVWVDEEASEDAK